MTHRGDDAGIGAQIGGGNLGNQFFKGILLRAEGADEIAAEPVVRLRTVQKFVERLGVPVDRLEIGLRRRYLHETMLRIGEDSIATNAESQAVRRTPRLDPGQALCLQFEFDDDFIGNLGIEAGPVAPIELGGT